MNREPSRGRAGRSGGRPPPARHRRAVRACWRAAAGVDSRGGDAVFGGTVRRRRAVPARAHGRDRRVPGHPGRARDHRRPRQLPDLVRLEPRRGTPRCGGSALVAWGTLVTSLFGLVIGAPDRDRRRAVHHPVRAAAPGPGPRLHRRPAGRGPSVVYGLWGIIFLVPHMGGVSRHRRRRARLDPDLLLRRSPSPRSVFAAGIVLAIMILPIVAAHQPRSVPADPARHAWRPPTRSVPPNGR